MFVLNYFYFLILTFLLFRYLQTKSKLIRDPLHRRQLLDFNGPELFWTLLFSALAVLLTTRLAARMGVRRTWNALVPIMAPVRFSRT